LGMAFETAALRLIWPEPKLQIQFIGVLLVFTHPVGPMCPGVVEPGPQMDGSDRSN
jgi:hypothetical protein